MRIIAGKHRGRRIELGKDPAGTIRPTSDFAREAIFNILIHGKFGLNGHTFEEKRALDLFCGTGAFGLEALSRGVAHVTFVDQAREAINIARRNAEMLKETDNAQFITLDATRLGKAREPYDIIFLDPPYNSKLIPPALESLAAGGWIADNAVIVAEHDAKEIFAAPAGFEVIDSRRYGRAKVEIIKHT